MTSHAQLVKINESQPISRVKKKKSNIKNTCPTSENKNTQATLGYM